MTLFRRQLASGAVLWLWASSKAKARKFKTSVACDSRYVRPATPAETTQHGPTAARVP